MTMHRVASLLAEAGVPAGVFQVVNGTAEAVTGLIDHPDVAAVTFVGSSRVAEIVAKRTRALNKRVGGPSSRSQGEQGRGERE